MTYSKILLSTFAFSALTFTGCGSDSSTSNNDPQKQTQKNNNNGITNNNPTPTSNILSGEITKNTTLTANKQWLLDGKVEVASGVTLTIEAGTTIAGMEGSNAWLIVYSGAKLIANGTATNPIIFTSQEAINGDAQSAGQWGGVTIIGNKANSQTNQYEVDDVTEAGTSGESSGSLIFVTINNTGIAIEQDKEINGLSLFGVSNKTKIENITVNRSGDDGIEIWGGDVNLKSIKIDGAQDDSFDTDAGWSGMVDGLTISNGKKAGIEMSGTSVGTYKNVNITITSSESEGGLYFKETHGGNVGGIFENVTITYNSDAKGAVAVHGSFDETKTKATNVILKGSNIKIVGKKDEDKAEAQQANLIF